MKGKVCSRIGLGLGLEQVFERRSGLVRVRVGVRVRAGVRVGVRGRVRV